MKKNSKMVKNKLINNNSHKVKHHPKKECLIIYLPEEILLMKMLELK